MLTTSYPGLQLTTQIQANRFEDCQWRYGGNAVFAIFRFNIACNNRTDGSFVTTCINASNHIITSLTVQSSITGPIVVLVECAAQAGDSYQTISSINLSVTGNVHFYCFKWCFAIKSSFAFV